MSTGEADKNASSENSVVGILSLHELKRKVFQDADHLHGRAVLANYARLDMQGWRDGRLGMRMQDAYMCKSPLIGAVLARVIDG